MYDENGDEILTYTAGVGWHEKESKAETEVHGALKSAYYDAYHAARQEINSGIAGMEQAEVLRDKSIVEEQLKKEQGRCETLLDMRMNNEIPKEVFSRKQQEVEERIKELEQQMLQYRDVKSATPDTPSEAKIIINHKNSRPSLANLAVIFVADNLD